MKLKSDDHEFIQNSLRRLMRRFIRYLVVVLFVIGACVPVDFVELSPIVSLLTKFFVVLGGGVGLALVWRFGGKDLFFSVLAIFLVLFLNSLASGQVVTVAAFLAPILVGMALAVCVGDLLLIFLVVSIVNSGSLLVDYAAGAHVVSGIFGAPYQVAFLETVFRARGVVGQAVPAALLASIICVSSFVVRVAPFRTLRKHRRMRAAILLLTLVAVYCAGTRSALVLLIFGFAVIFCFDTAFRSTFSLVKLLAVGVFAAFGVGVFAFDLIGVDAFAGIRLIDFAGLSDSASVENRRYAGVIYDVWTRNCDAGCAFLGFGARNLQTQLDQGLGVYGFTTVDNLYMSMLWDFGLLGVALFLGLMWVLFQRFKVSSQSPQRFVGVIGVFLIIASGFVFDSLYNRVVLVFFGFYYCILVAPHANARFRSLSYR